VNAIGVGRDPDCVLVILYAYFNHFVRYKQKEWVRNKDCEDGNETGKMSKQRLRQEETREPADIAGPNWICHMPYAPWW
jgi:hypothetical protein